MSLFDELRHDLITYLDREQIEVIHRAYLLASDAHKHQHRRSGEPYITHPLAVAHILCSLRMDYQSISAAILHDTMEDTPIEKNQLIEEFGQEIADLVDGVSKLTQIEFTTREQAQAENFRKMLLAMSRDIRVILVKLADRLHNMRTLGGLPPAKQRQKAIETLEIYAPIASRLGMYAFKMELEELGLATLYPFRYRVLQTALEHVTKTRQAAVTQIETALKSCLEKHHLPPSAIWYHQRHLYTLYKKMKREHLSFQEVIDFFSFRIIVDNIDDCYRALGAIHNLYRPIPEHFRDYIALPKTNHYQALHTTLFGPNGTPIEIQIRTAEMDEKAEQGITAHLIFKKGKTLKEIQSHTQNWLQGLMDLQQQNTDNPVEFIENVKIDLTPKEVYVFTPKGRIMELPLGATPVDFAYAIHSDIGNACIASKVDKRLVPLSTPLSNGQTIEIITAPGARPNPAWLSFIMTSKARSHIKNYLKELNHSESVALGERLLKGALKIMGTTLSKFPHHALKSTASELGYPSKEALYEAIGLGNQIATVVALHLAEQNDTITPPSKKKKRALIIKGNEGRILRFAECCHPIPGDPIAGFFETGQGVVVHTKNCPEAARTQTHNEPEHYLPVRWGETPEGDFKVKITVEVINQRGVLAQITTAISDADADIQNVNIEEHDGNYCSLHFTILVRNRTHLARVFRRLHSLNVVSRLARR
ncbi:MAG: bifunctional (p)ppGpp synthetase/guanosine-3',5'-bis(diphosphate) 3'-pyrophosphohydrolase [Gammaproteobacteria bacterium]|nr:bifunctional (p)ppGpp synthetase/guanosine-3',5'-bis(diphosphate) 3'-pyrophosphohydrolase [Gammaproteobacteria bacterium]